MIAGRKPKPTKMKLVQGTFRKDRVVLNEPKPRNQLPPCPDFLEGKVRQKCFRIGRKLERIGVLTETPLWEFYRPILQALAALGGIASRNEIESKLEETIRGNLKDGDFALNAQSVPRWKIMVRRARKHMIKEGFITGEIPFKWKITGKGDQAAKAVLKSQ
jgi:hypothetical protein